MSRRARCLCTRCNRVRTHNGGGLCDSCYTITRRPYVPTGVGRGGPGVAKAAGAVAGRIEDYAWLRTTQGHDRRAAAERLRISDRTAWRYEKRLRELAA